MINCSPNLTQCLDAQYGLVKIRTVSKAVSNLGIKCAALKNRLTIVGMFALPRDAGRSVIKFKAMWDHSLSGGSC